VSRQTARNLMERAYRNHYCVGAFNITNLIQMEAVIDAALELQSPVIIQTSVTPTTFFRPDVLAGVYDILSRDCGVPIAMQLDHCRDVNLCKLCIDSGYSSVMFDGSSFPWEENIALTREVADYAHAQGTCSVEGELGLVGGVEDDINVDDDTTHLCPPELVVEFVRRTRIDTMAPAIGTAHGVYKTDKPNIDLERFEAVEKQLNGHGLVAPLVVHGGTGLPKPIVNKLVALRAAKFNVSTELKHVLLDTTARYLVDHPNEYNPRRPGPGSSHCREKQRSGLDVQTRVYR
jgi:tagatose 1,6-diphosphate aldolase GatY/KbaY